MLKVPLGATVSTYKELHSMRKYTNVKGRGNSLSQTYLLWYNFSMFECDFQFKQSRSFLFTYRNLTISVVNRIILKWQFRKKWHTLQVFLCLMIALSKIEDFFSVCFCLLFLVSFCVCTLIYLFHILYCWVVIRFRVGVGLDTQRYLWKYNFAILTITNACK